MADPQVNNTHFVQPQSQQALRGDWSEHLETVTKSTEMANQNLVQQNTITYQQALSQIAITGISKCFEMISQANLTEPEGERRIEIYRSLIDQFNQMVQTASLVAVKAVQMPEDS